MKMIIKYSYDDFILQEIVKEILIKHSFINRIAIETTLYLLSDLNNVLFLFERNISTAPINELSDLKYEQ